MAMYQVTYDDKFGDEMNGVYNGYSEYDALLTFLYFEFGAEVNIEKWNDE